MKKQIFTILFLFAVCSGFQMRTTGVAGLVLDVNEARIAGATITVQNDEVKKIARSDDEGRFEVNVPPGTYHITVEQPGFKKFRLANFRVRDEATESINIQMEVAPPMLPRKIY